ncbi:GvpT/GvpP family gas vesicle accessory protein [Pseudalkalibacillus sp. Hm43]|uniref:GvpT/GvpP family gas vesicle accessory protein n=1 Tax=Pseudalkalibacillus sp. Hm43 TaxID=3450742 RepID=UPI003F4340CD
MGEEKKSSTNNESGKPLSRTVAGGILGAALGYFATPENGKKMLQRIDKEAIKNRGMVLGRSAKEKSMSAFNSVKTSTTDFINRRRNANAEGAETEVGATTEQVDTEEIEELRNENQKLQEKLDSLEEKINQLLDKELDEKKEDEESSDESKAKKKTTNSKSKKQTENQDDEEDDDDKDGKKSKSTNNKSNNNSTSSKNSTKKKEDDDTALTSDDDTSS